MTYIIDKLITSSYKLHQDIDMKYLPNSWYATKENIEQVEVIKESLQLSSVSATLRFLINQAYKKLVKEQAS